MEFKGAGNSQQSSSQVNHPQQQPVPRVGGEGNSYKMVTRDDGNKKVVWVGVLIAALLVLGGGAWWAWSKFASPDGVKTGQYQAVFLTNGQVYFCHLTHVTEQYMDCDGIYYLQVQSSVQPDNSKSTDQNPQVSLAKLGNELHGPEDHMAINRDQVLFWENLKDSGKVVQAIKQNQK